MISRHHIKYKCSLKACGITLIDARSQWVLKTGLSHAEIEYIVPYGKMLTSKFPRGTNTRYTEKRETYFSSMFRFSVKEKLRSGRIGLGKVFFFLSLNYGEVVPRQGFCFFLWEGHLPISFHDFFIHHIQTQVKFPLCRDPSLTA